MKKCRKNPANLLARECMVTALIQLLKEKPLSAITISELTEKAGVSRMTYYRNYRSKEEIFSCYLGDILEGYWEESRRDYPGGIYYDREHLVHCFCYCARHMEFLDGLFRSGYGHYFIKAVSEYVVETWMKPEDDDRQFYRLMAFVGSLYNLFISWYYRGARETPEQLAEVMFEIYHMGEDTRPGGKYVPSHGSDEGCRD